MSQARLTEAAAGSTSSSHATIACPPTSASIRQPSPITVSSKSPFHSSTIPVLKRDGLDATDPSNYRPIANVTFLSKIIERVAASQLIAYLEINKLLPVCQSGFRKGHSTETLLLRLLSDIYGA